MWDEVEDADIEDALGEVRLGCSFELGNFLGNDLIKGADTMRRSWSRKFETFFFRSRKRS